VNVMCVGVADAATPLVLLIQAVGVQADPSLSGQCRSSS
jgi:hypothetical protein